MYKQKIIGRFSRAIARLSRVLENVINISSTLDELKINQGIILSTLNQNKNANNLRDYEFKVFSQWGEDGIIQYLTKSIEIKNRTFIEFGVQDFFESNCRFLMMKDNWKGFVIDGSKNKILGLKKSYFYWKYQLDAVDRFITKENINDIVAQSGFEEDLGILSVDLDGNDYYILQAITKFKPRILICEYNAVFGGSRKITVPYQPDFKRTKAHYSNLYFGASLAAMTQLADEKGFALVGTNTAANNAFYVRKDLLNDKVRVLSVAEAYSPSNFRESRDEHGNFTYVTGDKRIDLIKGLPIFDIEKQSMDYL